MLEGTWGAFSLTILKCTDVFIFTVKTVIRLFLLTNSPYERGQLVYLLLAMQFFHVMQYVSALISEEHYIPANYIFRFSDLSIFILFLCLL